MAPIGLGTTVLQFFKLAVKNSLGVIINANAKILKFTGGVTVTQMGDDTVINVTPGGIVGDPNTVAFFNGVGSLTDDPGLLTYDNVTKVFQYPTFTTAQRNALPAQPVGTLIFNSTTQEFQTWDGAMWNPINAGTATPPNGDNNAIATFGPTGIFGDDPDFVWIAASRRFGIGRSSPQCLIQVRGANNLGAGTFAADGIIFGFTHPTQNLGAGSFVIGGILTGENYAPSPQSFAGGEGCGATGTQQCFAFGQFSVASGEISAVIGNQCTATNQFAQAFNNGSDATGISSHAEGDNTTASGNNSHSQNNSTLASGTNSHAEGLSSQATNTNAHAQNNITVASGQNSTSMGSQTTAQGINQLVIGRSNVPQGNPNVVTTGDDVFQVGNGTAENPFSITNDGKTRIQREILLPDTVQSFIAGGFIIQPNKTFTLINSNAAYDSDLVTPIAAGSENGQQIQILNTGVFNLTLKTGGNVFLPAASDFILQPNSTISLVWFSGNWYTLNTSTN